MTTLLLFALGAALGYALHRLANRAERDEENYW